MSRNLFKTQFFLSIALLTLQCGLAQDTIITKHQPFNLKPATDLDQRFYYVPDGRQNVWGYRAGVLINEKYKMGIGGYYMSQQFNGDLAANTAGRVINALALNKRLYLGTIYYEPFLLRRSLWEASIVFETGYGRMVSAPVDKTNNSTMEKSNTLWVPAGAGLSINFKLPPLFNIPCFRWLGINAMAGYRTTLYQQDKQFDYKGAYWSLSGAFFLDRLFEDYHSWKKIRAEKRDSRIIQLAY